ncbi:MAG: glycerol-3-phosphate acyltransferase [Coriobacteriia bacterium]|nr:glycerol-3-phosphate acyltransferase [Coriobacteriia bacterium]
MFAYFTDLAAVSARGWLLIGTALAGSYLVGSIPWSYLIVKWVTGEDITTHGTGNVGAMNVRRTTGSWAWFTLAMVLDGLKGLLSVLGVYAFMASRPDLGGQWPPAYAAQAAVMGAVLGHDFSLWLSLAKKRVLGGKGLATGGGALLAYDPVYFLVVLAVGLGTIALTRYMMAGQVAAAVALPVFALASGAWDWPFALLAGTLIYVRHHRRFVGLLRGEEPRLYVEDRMGPRG